MEAQMDRLVTQCHESGLRVNDVFRIAKKGEGCSVLREGQQVPDIDVSMVFLNVPRNQQGILEEWFAQGLAETFAAGLTDKEAVLQDGACRKVSKLPDDEQAYYFRFEGLYLPTAQGEQALLINEEE